MNGNDNTFNVLNFPIQKKSWEELSDCGYSDWEGLIQNTRIQVSEVLNAKALGHDLLAGGTLRSEFIEHIRDMNNVCKRYGCKPILEDMSCLLD